MGLRTNWVNFSSGHIECALLVYNCAYRVASNGPHILLLAVAIIIIIVIIVQVTCDISCAGIRWEESSCRQMGKFHTVLGWKKTTSVWCIWKFFKRLTILHVSPSVCLSNCVVSWCSNDYWLGCQTRSQDSTCRFDSWLAAILLSCFHLATLGRLFTHTWTSVLHAGLISPTLWRLFFGYFSAHHLCVLFIPLPWVRLRWLL